jgi:hypothetical protein
MRYGQIWDAFEHALEDLNQVERERCLSPPTAAAILRPVRTHLWAGLAPSWGDPRFRVLSVPCSRHPPVMAVSLTRLVLEASRATP